MPDKTKTDRIDFTVLADGRVVVTKMWAHPGGMKDIPHDTKTHKPGEFDLPKALEWCKENGFTVFTWPLGKPPIGARAWRGHPRPVRTAYQIIKLRQRLEKQAETAVYVGKYTLASTSPGWDYNSLSQADLAYVGESRPSYTVRSST